MAEAVKDAKPSKPLTQDPKCNIPPEIQRIQASKNNGNWCVPEHCETDVVF